MNKFTESINKTIDALFYGTLLFGFFMMGMDYARTALEVAFSSFSMVNVLTVIIYTLFVLIAWMAGIKVELPKKKQAKETN